MIQLLFFCGIGLFLSGVTTDTLAEHQHHTLAKRNHAKNKTRKKLAKKKANNKRTDANNILSPFTLRLLYPPNYRFMTKNMREEIDELKKDHEIIFKVSTIFPIATGIEGEFSFNSSISLAIMGSFSWQENFFTIEINDRKKEKLDNKLDIDYYEFTVNPSLYINANYFKLGPGVGLTFANISMNNSEIDNGKKIEQTAKVSYKKISAHL